LEKKKKKLRVMLGIVEIAANLWEFRNALREQGVQADTVVYQKHPLYDFPYDKYYPIQRNKLSGFFKSIPITLKLIFQYDVFFFLFGQSFFPRNLDIYLLKLLGKKVVVFFCGCDIRCREEVLKEDWLYSVCQDCNNECNSKAKRKLARFWEKHADLIFSHPEQSQLLTKPYVLTRLPFDLDYWKPFKSDIPKGLNKILIAHAPTDRRLKGTNYLLEAVNRLRNKGYNIELILLEGLSIQEVRKWLNASDIVVDQLTLGWHGKLSTEAMALGKPTISYINEQIQSQMTYSHNLPIVNSNPSRIYQDLKSLLDNEELRRELGLKSRAYMESTHSMEVVGAELKKVLESLYNEIDL